MLTDLRPLLDHIPGWLLVLFRLTGIFIFAPVFGSQTVPGRVKALLAIGLSLCVYPMLLSSGSASRYVLPLISEGLNLWTLGAAVGMEMMIGFVIGYSASLPLIGLQLGGRVVDQQMGLGLAGVLNPEFNEQTGVISEFIFILGLTMFVILGGHRVLLMTLVGSFGRIPLGGFSGGGEILDLVLGLLGTIFDLALRVATPILCLIFLETVAIGFIARTVPQMNILSIGFALRILLGGVTLIAGISMISELGAESFRLVLGELMRFFTVRFDTG